MNIEPRRGAVGWAVVLLLAAFAVPYLLGAGALALLGSLGCIAGAGVILVDWWYSRRADENLLLTYSDPDVVIMRMYAQLTPDERISLQESRIIVDHVLNLDGPILRWKINSGIPGAREYYPHADVLAVWRTATEESLAPIGSWPEGTIRRDTARALVQYFVSTGVMIPAAGNMPARWTAGGFSKAKKMMGLE